jgi:alkylated DNA repair dioxygenase AlkB
VRLLFSWYLVSFLSVVLGSATKHIVQEHSIGEDTLHQRMPASASSLFRKPSPTRRQPPHQRRRIQQQSHVSNFFGGDSYQSLKRRRSATHSRFGTCPLCKGSFSLHKLQHHAADCQGRSSDEPNPNSQLVIALDQSSNMEENIDATTKTQYKANECITIQSPYIMGSERTIAAEAINDESNVNSNGNTSQRQAPSASLQVAPLLSWPPPQPSLLCTTTNMIYSQSSTGATKQPLPPGLFLYPDYISQEEERLLLNMLDDPLAEPGWKASRFNGQSYGKRWGVHCNLRDRRVDSPKHALPSMLLDTVVDHRWDRLSCWRGNTSTTKTPSLLRPNEANAIDYRKSRGDWLQAHVDDRKLSKEPIANLSLAGNCYMTYRRTGTKTPSTAVAAAAVGTMDVYKVWLPPRCLQILTGPARYNYTHEIAHEDLQSERRVSITLRESPLTSPTTMGRMKVSSTPKIDTVFVLRKQRKK